MPNKYRSRKVEVNGIKFDSKKEMERYKVLLLQEHLGEIQHLQRQVKFELIPSQREFGKVIERPCNYVADFVYLKDGQKVVEDVKGLKKSEAYALYSIKRKLMLYVHGIKITEI